MTLCTVKVALKIMCIRYSVEVGVWNTDNQTNICVTIKIFFVLSEADSTGWGGGVGRACPSPRDSNRHVTPYEHNIFTSLYDFFCKNPVSAPVLCKTVVVIETSDITFSWGPTHSKVLYYICFFTASLLCFGQTYKFSTNFPISRNVFILIFLNCALSSNLLII